MMLLFGYINSTAIGSGKWNVCFAIYNYLWFLGTGKITISIFPKINQQVCLGA
jgi:hypothetical protein